ncbi:hypothetical protein, partial [Streptococcus sobrinus]
SQTRAAIQALRSQSLNRKPKRKKAKSVSKMVSLLGWPLTETTASFRRDWKIFPVFSFGFV